jgi:chemotaxis protein CheY-P-specific phosphatase CheC
VSLTPQEQVAQIVQHGAQESASALSRLLRRPVGVFGFALDDVSGVVADHGKIGVVMAFETSGGVPGHLAFIADEGSAARLVASLTGAKDADLNAPALMALAEVGNIAASAFLNGAARVVGKTCLPSVPRVSHAPIDQAVRGALPLRPVARASLQVDGADTFTLAFVGA